jgi:hypothetical protein
MKRIVFVTLICITVSLPVKADLYGTVDLKYTGVGPGGSMTISSSGINGGVLTGVYNLSLKNATDTFGGYLGDGTDTPFAVDAFCIDIWDYAPKSFQNYSIVSLDSAPDPGAGPMGATKAAHLAQLLDAHWNGPLTSVQASALQIATWEVVDESTGSYNVDSGSFSVTGNSSVRSLANTMLGSITTGSPFGKYIALSNSTTANKYQDYVVKTPIPASVILGLLGIGVVGIKLRKYA